MSFLQNRVLGIGVQILRPSSQLPKFLQPPYLFRSSSSSAGEDDGGSRMSSGPKIYTRTGDKGTSMLFTGERRSKDDKVFEALGTADELSCHIGLAREFAAGAKHPYAERLTRIQCILQDLGSVVATPKCSAREAHLKKVGFSDRHATELEEWIDEYTAELKPLKNFILPGGGIVAAHLHVARSVCRRAERCVAPLVIAGEADTHALIYLNRLSDFLFVVARYASKIDDMEEEIYIRCDGSADDEDPTTTTPKGGGGKKRRLKSSTDGQST